MAGRPPVHRIQIGAVSASIFENTSKVDGAERVFHAVVLERSYKKDGLWQPGSSLGVNDVPRARLALDRAYEWLVTQRHSNGDELPSKGGGP